MGKIFNLTEPQKQFIRDIKPGRSWRRVAEIVYLVYCEIGVDYGNQVHGIELCKESECFNSFEIAIGIVNTPIDDLEERKDNKDEIIKKINTTITKELKRKIPDSGYGFSAVFGFKW